MLKVQTPNGDRQGAAAFVLRTLLLCHHRVHAGERHTPHRILLQSQHLSAGGI